ncbi:hypothetical protein [Poseidonibacter lekithochrous]|nr:hypothetical protein [Poseidonibacter lekithochrous]
MQLHSVKVPNGIKFVEEEIAGELEHEVVKNEDFFVRELVKEKEICS